MTPDAPPPGERRRPEFRPLTLPVESRAIYLALVVGTVGALTGFILTQVSPNLPLAGAGSFGVAAACGVAIVAAVVSAAGYWRSRHAAGQTWRQELRPATAVVTVVAVVIAHTALAFIGTYVVFLVLSHGLVGLQVLPFFGTAMMGATFGISAYMVFRSVARTTTERLTSLLMSFVVLGTLTAAVTTPDPYWWKVHFSQLGTLDDISSWIFNGTLIAGGLLVATFAVYVAHDMTTLAAAGRLSDSSSPRTVSRLFVIMGVMLAVVGLVPVDVSFLVHTVAASGMAVVFLMLLIGGRRHLVGMPSTYFVAAWGFLAAIAASIVLFLTRYFSVTAFEIVVFALIFGWITVFIRFLGALGDADVAGGRLARGDGAVPDAGAPLLVVLAGLPGTGKTTLARALACELGAVHVRIDTIETALAEGGVVDAAGGWGEVPDAGYRVGYALAADHLRAGTNVIADSVNPLEVTRAAWRGVGAEAGARVVEVEVVCSDAELHRRRVEERVADIPGHAMPTWDEVTAREVDPWTTDRIIVDTATSAIEDAADVVVRRVSAAPE